MPGRIGEMTIIDGDVVELTNKNRQLPALDCNLGKAKAGDYGRAVPEYQSGD